jgi:hypothetical protein
MAQMQIATGWEKCRFQWMTNVPHYLKIDLGDDH